MLRCYVEQLSHYISTWDLPQANNNWGTDENVRIHCKFGKRKTLTGILQISLIPRPFLPLAFDCKQSKGGMWGMPGNKASIESCKKKCIPGPSDENISVCT